MIISQTLRAAASADIAIVGGGSAGLALAAALATDTKTNHLRIAVIESQDLTPLKKWHESHSGVGPVQFSNRVVNVTLRSQSFLESIGAWQYRQSNRIQPFQDMQVWDWNSPKCVRLSSAPDTNGYIIENYHISNMILQLLKDQCPQVEILDNHKVDNIFRGNQDHSQPNDHQYDSALSPHLELELSASGSAASMTTTDAKSQMSCSLLVGADGRNSPVRRWANIRGTGHDYNRSCMVATLELEKTPWPVCAYQRFLGVGPIAVLPLCDNRASLAFHTTPQIIKLLNSLSPETFVMMLNAGLRLPRADLEFVFNSIPIDKDTDQRVREELEWRTNLPIDLPKHEIPQVKALLNIYETDQDSRAAFPLRYYHAKSYYAPNIALVGDAAHIIHPLTGLGLNLGLSDVQALSTQLKDACLNGESIGSIGPLKQFESNVYLKNTLALNFCDTLNAFYNIQNSPVRAIRTLGTSLVGRLPNAPLKSVMHYVSTLV